MVTLLIIHIKKPRISFDSFRHLDKYDRKAVEDSIDPYDEVMSEYLKEIGRYEKEKNWSSLTSALYMNNYYPNFKDSLENQGFSTK